MKSLLFITPDSSYTGAPVYLLQHLRYLKQNSSYPLIVLFRNKIKGHSLLHEFEEVATVYHWDDIVPFSRYLRLPLLSFVAKVVNKFVFFRKPLFSLFFRTQLKSKKIALIFSNTTTIEERLLTLLKTHTHAPIYGIVHEGKKLLDYFNRDGTVQRNLNRCDALVCVSNQLKSTLQKEYQVTKTIYVVPGAVASIETDEVEKATLTAYGIPENAKVVLSCGWLSWHKGADLFVQTALQVVAVRKDVHFCWLGDPSKEANETYTFTHFQNDIHTAGIASHVHHIPSTRTPLRYMQSADVFLMLSRDESFSLVTIEACSLKKPVLCFERSGGPCEILDNDPTLVVPYGHLNVMSERILHFLADEKACFEVGEKLAQRVKANYTISITGQKILNLVQAAIC